MARRSGTKQRQMQCSTGNVCSRLLHNTYQPQAHQGPQKDPGAPQTTQKGEHIHPTTKPSENPRTPTRAPIQEREGQGPQLGRETAPSPQPEPKKGGKQRKSHTSMAPRGAPEGEDPKPSGGWGTGPGGPRGRRRTTPLVGMTIQTKPGPGRWSSEG